MLFSYDLVFLTISMANIITNDNVRCGDYPHHLFLRQELGNRVCMRSPNQCPEPEDKWIPERMTSSVTVIPYCWHMVATRNVEWPVWSILPTESTFLQLQLQQHKQYTGPVQTNIAHTCTRLAARVKSYSTAVVGLL